MDLPQRPNEFNNILVKETIGKTVVNAYGWTVGKVVGFSTDLQDSVLFLGIELPNNGFMRFEASKASYDQDVVVINNSWKSQVERLTNEITTIMKRISALDEFKEEISEKIHEDLQNKFENEKKVLLNRERNLSEKLKERLKEIEIQLNEILEFVVNVKISYRLGDINEEIYQCSNVPLQVIIDRLRFEVNDVKFALDKLSDKTSTLPPEPFKTLLPPITSQQLDGPIKLQIIGGLKF